MISLLPPRNKKELKTEKKMKMFFIMEILFLVFVLSLGLIFFSLKFYLGGKADFEKIILEQKKKEINSEEISAQEKKIASINEKLSQIATFYQQQDNSTEILERISSTLPESIFLTAFSLLPSKEDDYNFKVALAGFAENREDLFQFKKSLEQQAAFMDVYFPPSSWVEPRDINFNISFNLK